MEFDKAVAVTSGSVAKHRPMGAAKLAAVPIPAWAMARVTGKFIAVILSLVVWYQGFLS